MNRRGFLKSMLAIPVAGLAALAVSSRITAQPKGKLGKEALTEIASVTMADLPKVEWTTMYWKGNKMVFCNKRGR